MSPEAIATRPGTGSGAGPRRALITLCVTQVVSWGVLYYAFPVLSGSIAAATGWSTPSLTAAFSAGLVVSAVCGIWVGRLLDRHGPRWLMVGGSALATLAVVSIALAPSIGWFIGAWLLAGVAMSGTLYAPAFAALARWYGRRRVGALTILTLAGGLASTVFAPITAGLSSQLSWRATYLVLAGVLAVITIPAHMVGLRLPWPPAELPTTEHTPSQIARSRPFWALTITVALTALASYAVVVNLVPLLTSRGVSVRVAAVALGLGGAGQVLGRLGYRALTRRLGVRGRTVAVVAGVAVTTALLGTVTSVVALIIVAVAAGVMRGIMTLLQATAIPDRWGATHYGRLSALVAAPATITAALAPWIGSAMAAALGSYPVMFLVLAATGVVAVAAAFASIPPSGSQTAGASSSTSR